MRTTQEPDALCFGRFREHLHTLALAGLDIIFFALFKLDRLGVDREVHMPIRRIEAFLIIKDRQTINHLSGSCSVDNVTENALTGRTIKSGFPPTPSPLAALRIISLACFRLALLSAPIWPSWITARLNGLNAGAGGRVDISATLGATPLEVTGRASIESDRRVRDSERPCQRSIYGAPDISVTIWNRISRADGGRSRSHISLRAAHVQRIALSLLDSCIH